jgi:hypothetical protein
MALVEESMIDRTLRIVLVVLALVAAVAVAEESAHPTDYKSADCPDGDVYLSLNRDGTFTLVLDMIDRREDRSLGHRKIAGKWTEKDGAVTLTAPEARIVYRRERATFNIDKKDHALDALRFESSTKRTFADSWMLVDRVGMEKLAYHYAPPPPTPAP